MNLKKNIRKEYARAVTTFKNVNYSNDLFLSCYFIVNWESLPAINVKGIVAFMIKIYFRSIQNVLLFFNRFYSCIREKIYDVMVHQHHIYKSFIHNCISNGKNWIKSLFTWSLQFWVIDFISNPHEKVYGNNVTRMWSMKLLIICVDSKVM